MIVGYIGYHRDRVGVEAICAVLSHGVRIAPSGYYAATTRRLSPRARSDAALTETIEATFWDRTKGRGVYGPARCGISCARRARQASPSGTIYTRFPSRTELFADL